MNLDMLSGPQGRHMLYTQSTRWKKRVLAAFRGSLEAWRFLDPKRVDEVFAEVCGPNRTPLSATRAERKAMKRLLNAPKTEDVSDTR